MQNRTLIITLNVKKRLKTLFNFNLFCFIYLYLTLNYFNYYIIDTTFSLYFKTYVDKKTALIK
jgi:hypothetical protein